MTTDVASVCERDRSKLYRRLSQVFDYASRKHHHRNNLRTSPRLAHWSSSAAEILTTSRRPSCSVPPSLFVLLVLYTTSTSSYALPRDYLEPLPHERRIAVGTVQLCLGPTSRSRIPRSAKHCTKNCTQLPNSQHQYHSSQWLPARVSRNDILNMSHHPTNIPCPNRRNPQLGRIDPPCWRHRNAILYHPFRNQQHQYDSNQQSLLPAVHNRQLRRQLQRRRCPQPSALDLPRHLRP